MAAMEEKFKAAREKGALYHETNPPKSYMCPECSVFGTMVDNEGCWVCGTTNVYYKWVPRWGGGAQRVETQDHENVEPSEPLINLMV